VAAAILVDDPADPRLGDYIGLTDAALRHRLETTDGVFIAEGDLAIRALVASPFPVRSVLVTAARHRALIDVLEPLGSPVYVGEPELLRAVVGFDLHRGAVAAAGRLPLAPAAELVSGARLVLVVEAVNDHENLGALFRNAAAFGVEAVLLSPTCADPLYRRSVRVSLGHVLGVPFTRLPDWPAGLGALRAGGFTVVALSPRLPARSVDTLGPLAAADGGLVLMVGAEGPGLSAGALAQADHRVRVEMAPGVDSLNVATAAAVALHRAARLGVAGPATAAPARS